MTIKKGLTVLLTNEELVDLCRIILDRDADGALAFLDQHLKRPAYQAPEGG